MKRSCRSLFVLLGLCLPVLCVMAQDAAEPPPSKAAKAKTTKPKSAPKSSSKTANLKIGIITEIDAENSTLALNEKTTTNTYTLTDKTRYLKNRREAELEAFKAGEQAVVKLRKVRNKDEYVVQSVADPASWDWLEVIRTKPTQANITAIEDTTLDVTIGAQMLPFTFTISDKTHWSKNGKDALPTDFKAGDAVTILPRGLPSGNIMAVVVADSAQEAARTKERHARSVYGQITELNKETWRIVVALNPQDTREFTYSPKTLVTLSSRPVTVGTLKIGQKIRASLKQLEDNLPEAYRITIESKKAVAAKTSAKTPPASDSGKTLKGIVPNKK
jgi:hypothetical protein